MLQGIVSDCRHAVRLYRRTPMQSLSALIVVAVGIAFSTSFFSLYGSLALQSMDGIADDSHLVSVGTTDGEDFNPSGGLNTSMMDRLVEQSSTIEAIAGFFNTRQQVVIGDEQEDAALAGVTDGYFDGLDLTLAMGRGLDENHHAEGSKVVVLTHDYWQTRFAGADDIVGQHIEIDGGDYRVIGVAAPGFRGFHRGVRSDLFIPVSTLVQELMGAPPRFAEVWRFQSIGRLSPGAKPETARREVQQLTESFRDEFSDALRGVRLEVAGQPAARPYILRDAEQALAWFVAAAVLLVLVAATNLSLFFLARAPSRAPELRLRQSVGATRTRLFRQLLTETSTLVFVGTILGAITALWLAVALKGLPMFDDVRWGETGLLDWRVIVFTVALALLLSVACAIGPIWSLRQGPGHATSTRSVTTGWLQRGVTFLQITLATIVLAIGVLFTQTAIDGLTSTPTYDPTNITVFNPRITARQWRPTEEATRNFRRVIREKLEQAAPDASVVFAQHVPLVSEPEREQIGLPDGQEQELRSRLSYVQPEWFDAMGIAVRHGRVDEMVQPDVIAVNSRFAQEAWGQRDVVGKTVTIPDRGFRLEGESSESTYRIVAVTESVRYGHPARPAEPAIYLGQLHTLAQLDPFYIRSSLSGDVLAEIIQPALEAGSVQMKIRSPYALAEAIREATAPDRARALLTAAAAILVVVLAVMGFFGTLRYMVDTGRFEFALRAAVGASPGRVFRHVVNRGLVIAVPGLVIGAILALLALDITLGYFDVAGALPLMAAVLAVLLMAGLLAIAVLLPAQRAARIQPGPVLRED